MAKRNKAKLNSETLDKLSSLSKEFAMVRCGLILHLKGGQALL